jgi:hypothetical protein
VVLQDPEHSRLTETGLVKTIEIHRHSGHDGSPRAPAKSAFTDQVDMRV